MAKSKNHGKAAAAELRRIHAIGSKILKAYPVNKSLGAAVIERVSREYDLREHEVRQYRNFADRYSRKELVAFSRLCEEHNWAPGFTMVTKLMTIDDKKERLAITKKAAKWNYSLTKLQTEIFRRQGRRRDWVGRRPRLPATPEELIVELESMCIRWRRLNQQLELPPESDNKQVTLGDLPVAGRLSENPEIPVG